MTYNVENYGRSYEARRAVWNAFRTHCEFTVNDVTYTDSFEALKAAMAGDWTMNVACKRGDGTLVEDYGTFDMSSAESWNVLLRKNAISCYNQATGDAILLPLAIEHGASVASLVAIWGCSSKTNVPSASALKAAYNNVARCGNNVYLDALKSFMVTELAICR